MDVVLTLALIALLGALWFSRRRLLHRVANTLIADAGARLMEEVVGLKIECYQLMDALDAARVEVADGRAAILALSVELREVQVSLTHANIPARKLEQRLAAIEREYELANKLVGWS